LRAKARTFPGNHPTGTPMDSPARNRLRPIVLRITINGKVVVQEEVPRMIVAKLLNTLAFCGVAVMIAGCSNSMDVDSKPPKNETNEKLDAQASAAVGGQESSPPAWYRHSLIDLTHAFDQQTIYWPTEDGFKLEREKFGVTERGYFYASNRFVAAEHGGTHIDAPIHFHENGRTVDRIPLERLVGQGALVDVRKECEADPDYEITVGDLRRWEDTHRRTLADNIVLLYTGYCRKWPDRQRYLGTSGTGENAVKELHFPGLHPDAALWLAEHRAIKAVGIDTASIDHGQSTLFQSHVTLFAHDVPALENVARLEELPPDFTVIALPMKIGGGSGGPLRIIAVADH
jgi:kynurenine formamidase